MLLLEVLLVASLLILQLCQGTSDEIQYSYKVVSDIKGDDFGLSLATAHQRLVIGAPRGNYILPELGIKIRPPEGSGFGDHLDVNEQFMVVSGRAPDSVYIFSSPRPYKLVASIPVDAYVWDVKVLDDNTIYVASEGGHVLIYDYNHHSSWSRKQKIVLEAYYPGDYTSLGVSDGILGVGYYDGHDGRINIYSKVDNQYTLTTIFRPTEDVYFFGRSFAVDGQHLVVNLDKHDDDSILLTYELDASKRKWRMNGRFTVPSANGISYVSLQNNTLAATVNDSDNYPEVCTYVYKRSNNNESTNNNNNNNNTSNSNNSNNTSNTINFFRWNKVATLKTNGVPVDGDQYHYAISIQHNSIVTGRYNHDWGHGYGMVFVHDLSKH